MPNLNWHRYRDEFDLLTSQLCTEHSSDNSVISNSLRRICQNDPAVDHLHLGVSSYLVAFLEFLFFRAEGPFSPGFPPYARLIGILFSSCENLKLLINHNAPDALGNMVLNRRGRIKFAIADRLELMFVLDWWTRFGLTPVTSRQVFDAILNKSTIMRRIEARDPGLILRLSEVFPEYLNEFCPKDLTRKDLEDLQNKAPPLPSHRRYRRLYEQMRSQGYSLHEIIAQEEKRILPIQMRRNTFLAFLVKQLHGERCQICRAGLSVSHPTPVVVHHIKPLSLGGDDKAANMLVVCSSHHQAIHAGAIQVTMGKCIEVRSPGKNLIIDPNRVNQFSDRI